MPKHKLPPWLRPKPVTRMVRVGVGWYTQDQWQLVKASATDAERFEDSYAEWVAMADDSIRRMLAAGIVAERVPIIAADLLAWCLVPGAWQGERCAGPGQVRVGIAVSAP